MSSVSERLCRAAMWPWLSLSIWERSWSSARRRPASVMAASFCSVMNSSVASCFSARIFIMVENLTLAQFDVCWRVTYWWKTLNHMLALETCCSFCFNFSKKRKSVKLNYFSQSRRLIYDEHSEAPGAYLSLIYILSQVIYTFLRLFNEFPHLITFPFQQEL